MSYLLKAVSFPKYQNNMRRVGLLQWEIIPVTLNSLTIYSPNVLWWLSLILNLVSRITTCDDIDVSSYIWSLVEQEKWFRKNRFSICSLSRKWADRSDACPAPCPSIDLDKNFSKSRGAYLLISTWIDPAQYAEISVLPSIELIWLFTDALWSSFTTTTGFSHHYPKSLPY